MASVDVQDVSVVFPVFDPGARSLKSHVLRGTTGGRIGASSTGVSEIVALDGVSLRLKHGDRVGLIGHNGAGKTTLLRIMAGIYEPCAGRVSVEGKVAPVFDIAHGIDPESTGYENIRIRGLLLGMTKEEMASRFEEIVEFTGLGDFLRMPVRTYSVGMNARLAFAVSTAISPEVLLLDEGLVAGDSDFMQQADRRLEQLARRTGLLVLASHSDAMLRKMCNQGVVLNHGKIAYVGALEAALSFYYMAAEKRR
jgi:ABC-2 type transport system ATP-binding protein/lipopolysaccharide transport system ATP-binding protein